MELDNRWVLALLAAAFCARVAYGLHSPAKTTAGTVMDIDHYVELASSVADHGSLTDAQGRPSAEREPGYPMFLGLTFKIFGKGYLSFLIVQTLLSVGTLWLLFVIGKDVFGPIVGLGAMAVGVFYPQFIYYTAQPRRETWMAFVALLSIWLLTRAIRSGRPRDFALAGLCAAAGALTQTTFFPYGFFVAPSLALLLLGKPWVGAGRRVAVYMATFALLYALWPLRNYMVLDRWVLGSTAAAGDHFYMFMVVPEEIGGTAQHYEILAKDPIWQTGYALTPADRENFFWKAGLKKIQQNPVAYARLVAWRFFWDEWRLVPRPRDYGHSYRLLWWVSLLTDGWIIPFGVLGIILSWLRREDILIGVAFILSISFTYSLVLTMLRYRLILMPWMILFAVFALKETWRHLRGA